MAPKVNVPMDFGRHLIGSPTHSNMKLNTSEGGEVRASSVILSFNSPVIDHMTTTLHMTSVDMMEFSEAAVQLFVDTAYSGTAEGITQVLFRDINKIASVFEMSWLIGKCAEYFTEVADTIKTPCYTELLYLFEEAGFVLEHLKTKDYLNVAIKKIEMLKWKQQFIEKYLENAERLSTQKLDMVIELAGTEVNCVVQTLTNQLTELLKVQGSSKIPVSCAYLLDNLNLHLCKKSFTVMFDQLFDLLLGLPDENIRWACELFRKSIKEKDRGMAEHIPEAIQSTSPIVSRCNIIQNLYHNIDMNMTQSELMDWLAVSETVTNLLMAIEAVKTWNQHNFNEERNIFHIDVSLLYDKLNNVAEKRNWSLLPSQLSKYSISLYSGRKILRSNLNLSQLCSSSKDNSPYHVIGCVETCDKPLSRILSKESKLVFYFKHPSVTSCNLPGECGFILKTVPSEAALWTLRLCTEKEDYLNDQVHFHDEIRAENMYVYYYHLQYTFGRKQYHTMIPLSWLGGLTADNIQRWETAVLYIDPNSRFKVLYKFK